MVQDFRTESLPVNFLQKAALIFFSRNVISLFTHDQKLETRELEAKSCSVLFFAQLEFSNYSQLFTKVRNDLLLTSNFSISDDASQSF